VGRKLGFTQLKAETTYSSINSGGVLRNEDYDSEADASDVLSAMQTVGLDPNSIESVWRTTAGILHLLNVKFSPDPQGNGCQIRQAL
jgi:myosin heavy subunit